MLQGGLPRHSARPLSAMPLCVEPLAQLVHPVDQLMNALVASGAHRQHGQPQRLAQTRRLDRDSKAPRLIAHVQGHHHRQGQGFELQQQAQLAGNLGGIQHHQEQIRRGVAQEALHPASSSLLPLRSWMPGRPTSW